MSVRQILVHVPSHRRFGEHVAYAARVARSFDAKLAGLYAVEQPYSAEELSHVDFIAGSLVAQLESLWAEAELAGTRFVAAAQDQGAKRPEWLVGQGDPTALLAYAAASRELLVLGVADGMLHASPALVARAVLASGTSCLVVPEQARSVEPVYGTVAVAWNGSIESIRALHGALPFLALAQNLVILRGRRRDDAKLRGMPPFDLDRFLDFHGITGAREVLDSGADGGDQLPARALERGATLLVMGAYGHGRFSEWVLGGATRHALHHAAIPLLMRH